LPGPAGRNSAPRNWIPSAGIRFQTSFLGALTNLRQSPSRFWGRSSFPSDSSSSERSPDGATGETLVRLLIRRLPAADCSGGCGAAWYLPMFAQDLPAFFQFEAQSRQQALRPGGLPHGNRQIVSKTPRMMYRPNAALVGGRTSRRGGGFGGRGGESSKREKWRTRIPADPRQSAA
jgi:hypothetical protein